MKAEIILRNIREDMEELKQLHEKWVETDGNEGLQCFNYDEFLKQYNRTDREILDDVENKTGFIVIDKEEYLSK